MKRLAIVGATATGKTRLAVDLARRLGEVELVSVDAMAVYRGLDIGTAKPNRDARRGVGWHLVDVVAPSEEFSVAQFQQMVRDAIVEVEAAGRTPWLVGGTGLYHRAVIDDLDIPPQFPAIRASLEAEVASGESAVGDLYARLDAADPVAARRTESNNVRRIVRALEVIEGTGRRFSSFGPGLSSYGESPWTIVGLELDRDQLDASIERRLDDQLRDGFVEETAGLLARPGGLSRTARQALGYRELIEHLEGARDFPQTKAAIARRTRSFARRQESWFGRDPRVHWMRADRPDLVDAVEALVMSDRM